MAKNDFRVTSIFKIIIRICMKNVEFCRKNLSFYPKDVCSFSVLFIEMKRSKPTSMSNKICRN